jgi:2-polyprenyl-3-methyl-5-hydroxy-6-metoxy-1,4-benzoquinol methylase
MAKNDTLASVSRAYGRSRWLRGYVAGKLTWDPVFQTARRMIVLRDRPVVDLGCGLGILGLSMRAAGIPLRYRGSDLSAWKVNKAKEAVRYFGFEDIGFEVNDVLATSIPEGSSVCMFDVLHYLPSSGQQVILERMADAAQNGSLVLIRTGLKSSGWRYMATLAEEFWTRATGWIRGGEINFPQREQLLHPFTERGLKASITPLWGRTPFASYLVTVEPVEASSTLGKRRAA